MLALVIGVYVILSVSGVVLVKLGRASPLELSLGGGVFRFSLGYVTLAGFLCYIVSFLLYMSLIARHSLGFLVPVCTGCVYLLTLISSVAVFKEKLSAPGIVGSLLILAGVLLVSLKN